VIDRVVILVIARLKGESGVCRVDVRGHAGGTTDMIFVALVLRIDQLLRCIIQAGSAAPGGRWKRAS
jgi:hypothetical protein